MHSTAVRPTRRRLVAAMGVSAGLLALLLVLLDVFLLVGPGPIGSGAIREHVLRVLIRRDADEPDPAVVEAAPPQIPSVEEALAPAAEAVIVEEKTPRDPRPTRPTGIDWNKAIVDSVAAMQAENQATKESRQSMWRQTHSVMFRPQDEFVPREEAPVLAEFRFKPEIHVAGLGVTIGSCFIGLPIVGVPVAQRSIAIRLFVCAGESG